MSFNMAGRQRDIIGNFDISAGRPPLAETDSFAFWSNCKRRVFFIRGPRLFYAFFGLSVLALWLLSELRAELDPALLRGFLALVGTAWVELLIACFADVTDLARHHLVCFAEFDLLLLFVLRMGLSWFLLKRGRVPAR